MSLSASARLLLLCATFSLGACASNGKIGTIHDPFTGDRRGFVLYLDPGHFTGVSMSESKDKYALEVLVVQRGDARFKGRAGDKGQFIVGGEMLEFATETDTSPVVNVKSVSGVFTQWKPTFNLTREQAARFAAAPLTAIKVWVGEQTFQLELDPSSAQKFQINLRTMTQGEAARSKG
jgi:hypothetical protein